MVWHYMLIINRKNNYQDSIRPTIDNILIGLIEHYYENNYIIGYFI